MRWPEGITLELVITRSFCHFTLGFWIAFAVAAIIVKYFGKKILFATPWPQMAAYVGLWGGVANVFVDIDHLALFFGFSDGKFLHTPCLWVAGILTSYSLGCLFEALDRPSHEKERGATNLIMILSLSLSVMSHVLEDN